MKNTPIYSLLLALFVCLSAGQIGNECKDKYTNEAGSCKLAKDCPSAVAKIKVGIHPTLCGYQNRVTPIVCCEGTAPAPPPPVVKPLNSNSFVYPSDNGNSLRVSERKCEEYANLTKEYVNVLALVTRPNPTTINFLKCDHNGVPLVVGGKPAVLGEFPFMAALRYADGNYACGGTLISDNFVMTAAHCVRSKLGTPVAVRMGALSLIDPEDSSSLEDVAISDFIIHPQYTFSKKYNDIALLRLSKSVKFTKNLRPACLFNKRNVDIPKAIATGWGATSFGGDLSLNALQRVTLDILPNSKCNDIYGRDDKFPNGVVDTMLCSGVLTGGKDTCQGDSGGPLLVTQKNNNCLFYAVGVTSFGRACGFKNIAAIYTRVSEYVPWIEQNVWPNQ